MSRDLNKRGLPTERILEAGTPPEAERCSADNKKIIAKKIRTEKQTIAIFIYGIQIIKNKFKICYFFIDNTS
ncbi:MAG: hypothetical protein WC614_09995 [bacterium]